MPITIRRHTEGFIDASAAVEALKEQLEQNRARTPSRRRDNEHININLNLESALVVALQRLDAGDDFKFQAAAVLDLFEGVPSAVFRTLDEKPGRHPASPSWHHKLRRVRNCPHYGPDLFSGLA